MKKGIRIAPESVSIGVRISKDMRGSVIIISDDSGDSSNKVLRNLIEFGLFYVYTHGYNSLKKKVLIAHKK
jgi:hypothetical protein